MTGKSRSEPLVEWAPGARTLDTVPNSESIWATCGTKSSLQGSVRRGPRTHPETHKASFLQTPGSSSGLVLLPQPWQGLPHVRPGLGPPQLISLRDHNQPAFGGGFPWAELTQMPGVESLSNRWPGLSQRVGQDCGPWGSKGVLVVSPEAAFSETRQMSKGTLRGGPGSAWLPQEVAEALWRVPSRPPQPGPPGSHSETRLLGGM